MIRQPVGVVAVITPFRFPGMILWFLLYAVATATVRHREAVGAGTADDAPPPESTARGLVFRPASSTSLTVARRRWTRCSITLGSGPSRSSRSPSRVRYCAGGGERQACQAQGGAKNSSSCFPTRIWR